jgi:hypothetical protein
MIKKFINNSDNKTIRKVIYIAQALSLSPAIYFIYLCFIGTATKEQLNFWAMLSLLAGVLFFIFMLFLIKILMENNDHK